MYIYIYMKKCKNEILSKYNTNSSVNLFKY